MSEWQSIDTAPKDGTLVLLAHDGRAHIGFWGANRKAWLIRDIGPVNVAHWMPLPEPPKLVVDPAQCSHADESLDFPRGGAVCKACGRFRAIDASVWDNALL